MHAAWTSACHDLAAVQAAWNKVLRQDLPRMNGVLKRNGLSVLAAPVKLAQNILLSAHQLKEPLVELL